MEQNLMMIFNFINKYNISGFDRYLILLYCQDFEFKLMEIFIFVVLYSIVVVGGLLGNILVFVVIR